jgi:hypothetical protein
MNHRNATPANGMRFNAIAAWRQSSASHSPASVALPGTALRNRMKIAMSRIANTIPAIAAAFGVLSCAPVDGVGSARSPLLDGIRS